jgi:hypothetical protein
LFAVCSIPFLFAVLLFLRAPLLDAARTAVIYLHDLRSGGAFSTPCASSALTAGFTGSGAFCRDPVQALVILLLVYYF